MKQSILTLELSSLTYYTNDDSYSLHTQHIRDQGFVLHLSAEDEVERERRERRERREKNLTEEEVCLKYTVGAYTVPIQL